MHPLKKGFCIVLSFSLIILCYGNEKTEEDAMVDFLSKNNYLQGKAEIVFLLDRSGSVGAADFEIEIGFVHSFLSHIVVDVNASRVAVISYSDDAKRHIDFLKDPKSKCFLSQELHDIVYENSGATNIVAALEEARDVFKNARPNVNKVIVLVSDGFANRGGDPVATAAKLKAEGVEIFCFGVGRYIRTELEHLASSLENVFVCKGFSEFKRLATKIRGDPHELSWSSQTTTPNCDYMCNSIYRGEPFDPGCCDPDARCSCALLSGVHTCVCKPGYYGLSGLIGDCRACGKGTYKSKLEPSSTCTPCPLGSTTATIASTKVSDCFCKEGYSGDPSKGVPCKAVECPPLQEPTNGYILGSCDVTYGSNCHFMCKDGYELVDPRNDVRVCQSNGKWTGETATCREIRCNSLHAPKFGMMRCDPYPLTVGKKCSFRCRQGYVMQGPKERICTSSKMWTNDETTCIPVTCEVLPRLLNGRYPNCDLNQKPVYYQTCIPICYNGFELQGAQYLTCRENGAMLDENGGQKRPYCKDKTPPIISCPRPFAVAADKGKSTATVNWNVPHPSDNSGYTPKLITKPAHISPPQVLAIGVHNIQYIAIDSAGLRSNCSVQIKVIDREKPAILWCPPDMEINTNGLSTPVFWDEPLFLDNSNKSLLIKKDANPGDVFQRGSRIVHYDAYDESKNMATCEFRVIVSRTACPHLPPPMNGALACDELMYGEMCQVFCNEKYDFTKTPADWYICNENTQWETYPKNMPIPWPDCAQPVLPTAVRRMVDLYYKGDCNDPMVQRHIKKLFLNHITESVEYSHLCKKHAVCSIKNIEVRCGITNAFNRKKRSVWQHVEKEQLEVEFEITINTDEEFNDTEAVLQDFLQTIRDLKWDNDDELVFASTLPPIENIEERDGSEGLLVIDEKTTLVCKPGSIRVDDLCVLCSSGTFYDASTQECIDCPLGYYQEHQGQLHCEKCAEGLSTEHTRTRNETLCKGICTPGTYSSTGLETCISCPIGKYQDSKGMTSCYTCPNGTTTESVGAISINDCKDGCPAGSFSENGLEPCRPCPLHHYQPLSSQTDCLECPQQLSTDHVGATDLNECIDIDPCLANITCMHNGTCTRDGRNADCDCIPRFHGIFCEKDIDECELQPCANSGQCINTEGSFYCECLDGFSGPLCDSEIDECASGPCQNNGTCIDKVNGYTCVCSIGYEGINCEIEKELCFEDVECLNGGVCTSNDTLSFCDCPPGFAGIDCSQNINDCENITCKNGGSCVDGINSFTCTCSSGYTGLFCEVDIDECENNDCQSGSTCEDSVGAYKCLCPPGWNGTYCENQMDSDFILMFPESTATIGNFASLKMNSPLTDATISMWIQTNDTERSGTPLSYAVASTKTTGEDGTVVDNALTISDCSDVKIYVNNEPVVTDLQVADGEWHHLAFTWSSQNSGAWALYKDGELKHEGKNLQAHEVIDGGGRMVIGQEQDIIGGGFSPLETFTGNITRVNIWNRYFSKSNITRLCRMDDDISDKVVAWPDFLQGLQGSVNIVQNSKPTTVT